MIFDTHAHYDDEKFNEDRYSLIESLYEKGVGEFVNVGANMQGSRDSIDIAKKYPYAYAAVGVHPSDCGEMNENDIDELEKMCMDKKVVAVGEIGLDYYWPEPDHEIQKKWFKSQLDLAVRTGKPVIIHSRDAAADTMTILKSYSLQSSGAVIHCFSYSSEIAKEYLDMGFYIGVGGVLTFKNGKKLRQVVQETPIERILLETDCPYMAPEPYRGKRNDSSNIIYVVNELARIKEMPADEIIRITKINAHRFYGISK